MRRAGRISALVLSLVTPLAAGAALGPRYGGTLRVGVQELPGPAPAACRSADERLLWALVHETLVQSGPEGHALPALAAAWTSAASRREWVLQLREDAAFHDGTPVSSEDAVRSLRRFLRSPSPAAEQLAQALAGGLDFRARTTEALPGLEARAPRAVVLRLERARALPLAPLAAPAAALTSAAGAGAGPFAPTGVSAGRRAGFVAAAVHLRGRPYLDRVEVSALDEAALAGELQSGRLDVVPGGRDGPLAAVLMLAMDATRPPFDREAARAAVAASLDRSNLVRHLVPGGQPAASLLPPLLLAPLPLPPSAPAAPLRAAATLAVSREVPSLVGQRVVAHLTDLGLQVTVDARPPSRVLEGPPATLRLWLWSPEVAETGLALRELARMAPRQAAVEDALAAAEAALDPDQRRAHHYRAEAALRATNALVPLAMVPAAYRAARRVQGVRVDEAARIRLEDAWWEP